VHQGAELSFEHIGFDNGTGPLELTNADGEAIALSETHDRADVEAMTTRYEHQFSQRVSFAPAQPLPPGDYTFSVGDGASYSGRYTTFTVLEGPPTTAPPAPTLDWRKVAYTGQADPPFQLGPPDSCSGISSDPTTAFHKLDARADTELQGRFVFRLERAGDDALERTSFTSTSAQTSWTREIYGWSDEFVECVEVTFVDVYGRESEPTRQCVPDGCEVRDKNDRRGIDWADVDGCSDWSPGWVERNPPGCGCAQSPGAPAAPPLALALGALGLFASRRRF
jgi:MYXO-CTERM domain-containing protein